MNLLYWKVNSILKDDYNIYVAHVESLENNAELTNCVILQRPWVTALPKNWDIVLVWKIWNWENVILWIVWVAWVQNQITIEIWGNKVIVNATGISITGNVSITWGLTVNWNTPLYS